MSRPARSTADAPLSFARLRTISKSSSCSTPVTRRRALLRDPRLLPSGLVEVPAELPDVVERHVRHHADGRVGDVRRVVLTAEPGLDRGGVHGPVEERLERERGEKLEVRQLVADICVLDHLDVRLADT